MSVLLRENHQLSRRGGNEVWGGSQNWFMPLFSWQNLFLFIETFIKPSMKRKQFLWRGRRKMPTKKICMSALRARVRWNCWNSPNKVLNEYMHWNQVSFNLSTIWNSGHIHLLFCCFLAVLFLQLHVPSWGRGRDAGFYRSEEFSGWLWLYFQLAEVFLLSLYVSVCTSFLFGMWGSVDAFSHFTHQEVTCKTQHVSQEHSRATQRLGLISS